MEAVSGLESERMHDLVVNATAGEGRAHEGPPFPPFRRRPDGEDTALPARVDSEGFEAGVKRAALQGAAWTIVGYGGMQVLRFGCNLLLTRLLAPRLFGLMALVNLFILSLHMFSDIGLLQAVIQSKRGDDPDFLNAAWTLQVVRGLVLWLGSGLIAWPVARFYGEPALLWLIPLAGSTAAITGFSSTAIFTLSRRLLRSRLVLLEVATYVVSASVMLVSVWLLGCSELEAPLLQTCQLAALVVGSVLGSLFEMAVSYRLAPDYRHRHRFRWGRDASPELLHFGGWIFVSTACTFLASQADRLVIGKISVETLGVYHVAATLAAMPLVLMFSLSSQLVFPLYSRLIHSGQDLRASFAGIHRTVAGFGALLAAGMVCVGPTLIGSLYDTRYRDAGWYLQLLTVATWFAILHSTSERILMARGLTRSLALAQAVKLGLLPLLLAGGFRIGGLTGMILGFAAAEVSRYAVITWLVRRQGFAVLLCDASATLLIVGIVGLVLGGGPRLWGSFPPLARLAVDTGAVVLLWSVVFVLWRGLTSRERQRPELASGR